MTKGLFSEPQWESKILVIGVGGAGCNLVNNLSKTLKELRFLAINTEANSLERLNPDIKKICIGRKLLNGAGAYGDPKLGERAAKISRLTIRKHIGKAPLVFVCAGLGGGTGTGASPVIARIAKEKGAIVESIITMPFSLERTRVVHAKIGMRKLLENSDSITILDNNLLVKISPNERMSDAFNNFNEIMELRIREIIKIWKLFKEASALRDK